MKITLFIFLIVWPVILSAYPYKLGILNERKIPDTFWDQWKASLMFFFCWMVQIAAVSMLFLEIKP